MLQGHKGARNLIAAARENIRPFALPLSGLTTVLGTPLRLEFLKRRLRERSILELTAGCPAMAIDIGTK
jgi:hypothetical protein